MATVPLSTYRLQFHPGFGFEAARSILDYLSKLGIDTLYASPIFHPVTGSAHGYDVVDPGQLNSELGAPEDFERLVEDLKGYAMSWLQDIVPNHMAVSHENRMLVDVLENGPSSQYIQIFDIDWEHPYEGIQGRVLAPFLGGFYGETLENGEIRLSYDADGLAFRYYDWRLPLRIESYLRVLTHELKTLRESLGREHPNFIKFLGILYALRTLPSTEDIQERYDQITFIKRMLWELYITDDEIKEFVNRNIEIFNGRPGDAQSFRELDALLLEQHFRLSFWKVATQEINYRRFFNINGLICVKVEDPEVFDKMHALALDLIRQGKISGLRIDHIDGLYDPAMYLQRLRRHMGDRYLAVEKILDLDEDLPPSWPVHGTTGYDFLNHVNGLFCKPENETAFQRLYSSFTGFGTPYEELVYQKKQLIIEKHMTGDVDNLALMMKRLSSRDRHGYDITFHGIKRAVTEVLALFPVYRTYVGEGVFSQRDRSLIHETIQKAIRRNPDLVYELSFMDRHLLMEFEDYLTEQEKEDWMAFIMRFQQFTGPLMAKGFEDTTLYVYNRLLSLNDVGGDPQRFGLSPEDFHAFNEKRAKQWPHALNATSTHDTKRGEDVRARLNVLSEMPEEWERRIRTWSALSQSRGGDSRAGRALDKNDEYMLYQTLVGTYPFAEYDEDELEGYTDRIKDYIVKAVREAKVHTAWLKPDSDYEDGFLSFAESLLEPGSAFFEDFLPFQTKVARYGIWNSLSQTLLKITSPGAPDFYQGSELWDLCLVDPDNRRPVDYHKRKGFLAEIIERGTADPAGFIGELLEGREDGRIKLFLIHKALQARKADRDLFERGTYLSLETQGQWKDHVVAFARKVGNRWALSVAPRFLTAVVDENQTPLGEAVWKDTQVSLPSEAPASWRNVLTGRPVKGKTAEGAGSQEASGKGLAHGGAHLRVGELLRDFPVALLRG